MLCWVLEHWLFRAKCAHVSLGWWFPWQPAAAVGWRTWTIRIGGSSTRWRLGKAGAPEPRQLWWFGFSLKLLSVIHRCLLAFAHLLLGEQLIWIHLNSSSFWASWVFCASSVYQHGKTKELCTAKKPNVIQYHFFFQGCCRRRINASGTSILVVFKA